MIRGAYAARAEPKEIARIVRGTTKAVAQVASRYSQQSRDPLNIDIGKCAAWYGSIEWSHNCDITRWPGSRFMWANFQSMPTTDS